MPWFSSPLIHHTPVLSVEPGPLVVFAGPESSVIRESPIFLTTVDSSVCPVRVDIPEPSVCAVPVLLLPDEDVSILCVPLVLLPNPEPPDVIVPHVLLPTPSSELTTVDSSVPRKHEHQANQVRWSLSRVSL